MSTLLLTLRFMSKEGAKRKERGTRCVKRENHLFMGSVGLGSLTYGSKKRKCKARKETEF